MTASRASDGGPARLRFRAAVLARLRAWFAARGILEVQTPVLAAYASTEPALGNFRVEPVPGRAARFLRTSPESALKQLVASGYGDVYEIGPVFRPDEAGRRHRPEFTLVEWYRLGIDHLQLAAEVGELLRALGYRGAVAYRAYADVFRARFGADPHGLATADLAAIAARLGAPPSAPADRAALHDAIFAFGIEPGLAREGAVFVHGFPVEQRAYARLAPGVPPVAERFELLVDGLELANGYHEIVDPHEQAGCFERENRLREQRGLPRVAPDRPWLAALAAGMPPCAGVALGLERLLMALTGARAIEAVGAFADPFSPVPEG